jgi:DNA gyrase subunit A
MGRSSRGVTGIKLGNDDELTSLLRVDPASPPSAKIQAAPELPLGLEAPAGPEASTSWERMLILSEYGFGKRVEFGEFSSHGRGTGGQRIYTVTERTGEIVGCVSVLDNEEIMCITSQGKSIKLKVNTIRVMGRSAQGVRILSIDKPDFVVGVDRIVQEDKVYEKKGDPGEPGPAAAETPSPGNEDNAPEDGAELGKNDAYWDGAS